MSSAHIGTRPYNFLNTFGLAFLMYSGESSCGGRRGRRTKWIECTGVTEKRRIGRFSEATHHEFVCIDSMHDCH